MQQSQGRQFEDLKSVQREAAWFPFPTLLREFNRDFNFCAAKLNWMRTASLAEAENFHKTREFLPQVDEHIRTLRTRLITLRIVRDSTFFVMSRSSRADRSAICRISKVLSPMVTGSKQTS